MPVKIFPRASLLAYSLFDKIESISLVLFNTVSRLTFSSWARALVTKGDPSIISTTKWPSFAGMDFLDLPFAIWTKVNMSLNISSIVLKSSRPSVYCPDCGTQVQEDFCPKCGKKVR